MCERDECYIGSTSKTVACRFRHHKCTHECSSSQLFERYGADRLEIIELEECSDDDRYIRERWWIENNYCLNKKIPFRDEEERLETHRESARKYREANLEKVKESNRESARKWRERNPEMNREIQRKWKEDNPEKYAEQIKRGIERQRLKRIAEKSQANV